MSTSNGPKLCLKVVINKQIPKVLFAEANSDVVDVLLSFLTLPLGKLVKILENHCGSEAPVVGSLTSLYRGLVNLDSSHFCVAGAKQMLRNPTSSFQVQCRRLKLDISGSQLKSVYFCQDSKCLNPRAINASMYSDIADCDCGKPLNRERLVPEAPVSDGGAFLIKSSSFIICDDLRVVPVVSGFLQTLNNLGITHTDGAELTTLSIGINEIMDLLKFSLISTTPLTDLVMKKTRKSSTTTKPELLHRMIQNGDAESRKMVLKVFLHKSTDKFLLAEATDEFVEFLFSFLTVPLGGVEYLLGGNTCLKNIDNLYKTVKDVIDNKYFMSPDAKEGLMNPKLAHGYISKNQFLPLSEKRPHVLEVCGVSMVFKQSKCKKSVMKEETMYIVSDDLTVSPFSITSSFSIINDLGISLSDVKEKDFQIGVEEALDILEASLTSTTVFTDALINPMLNKPPKRPKIEPPQTELPLFSFLAAVAESEPVLDLGMSIAPRPIRAVPAASSAIVSQFDALNTMIADMSTQLSQTFSASRKRMREEEKQRKEEDKKKKKIEEEEEEEEA